VVWLCKTMSSPAFTKLNKTEMSVGGAPFS
jgi:hypothetical protein